MPATVADHSLLVGALALQFELASPEELAGAARDCERGGESASLAEVLRDRGVLSDDECELLGALVRRSLSRHDNNLQRSLASCASTGRVRELFARLGLKLSADRSADAELRSSECADPHATRRDDQFQTTPGPRVSDVALESSSAPTLPLPPHGKRDAAGAAADASLPLCQPAALRYRVLRPFQRGGLGQVSVARDEELHREVALKEILPKHADSAEARQRFLMEAEITGSLEHPGVVPVYGLGQYADGRPFYAMRFIRGDTLQWAIEQYHSQPDAPDRELRFRHLLGRLVDVCNAVEYAHNRCVLHRDLKPTNVMLGHYGETLVVDWGLAKAQTAETPPSESVEGPVRPLSAESSSQTRLGHVVGTPAYMSPEQAAGRIDQLGPATDVYSLGATLYQILVGRAPFAGDDHDALLGNVQLGRFQAPRAAKNDVPRSLEAICLKAMALRPADRYPSARALADDVERFLADEPVLAYPEPVSARAWRWMRRHRAAVVGAGAGLIAVAGLLAAGLVLLGAANRRAERNFDLARNAIRDYYFTVSEEALLDRSDLRPLRAKLLRRALAYYQQFLASAQQQSELRGERAQASLYAGRITESLDSSEKALPYYQQAHKISSELVAERPGDEAVLEAHARALEALGESMEKLNRWNESRTIYREVEVVRKKLVDDHPENDAYKRDLAAAKTKRESLDASSAGAVRDVDPRQRGQKQP